jgi:hypothetical protein
VSAGKNSHKYSSSNSSESRRLSLYIRADVRSKLVQLAGWLDTQGVSVRDQRGNLSLSATIAYLVNEKASTLADDGLQGSESG